MFDIHKVRPLHGWREFVGEVGIIVLGVLIALTAEQVAEGIHWRREVAEGQAVIAKDLEHNISQAFEREAISACIGSRLNQIAAIIDQASKSGNLPAVGDLGNPPHRVWDLQSWNSLSSAQTATHFSRETMLVVGSMGAFLSQMSSINDRETDSWTTLYTMVGPGRQLASGEEANLRAALSSAVLQAKLMLVGTHQFIDEVTSSGLLTTRRVTELKDSSKTALKQSPSRQDICQPIKLLPAHYGQSPYNLDLTRPYRGL